MSFPPIEPIAIQRLGEPFFRQYMARYTEEFQVWVMQTLKYEFAEAYEGKNFPHISEVPKGYVVTKNKKKSTKKSKKSTAPHQTADMDEEDDWLFSGKLSDVAPFTYLGYLKESEMTDFYSTYIQFMILEYNDANLETNMLREMINFTRYSKLISLLQICFYIGDYIFHSPTKIDDITFKRLFYVIDFTQLAVEDLKKHPLFHIQLLTIFNRDMPESDKVSFIVEGMLHTYHQKGVEEAEYYFRLLELTETPKNRPALNQIFEILATSPEFQHLHRNALDEYPREMDVVEHKILEVMVEKTIRYMYKTRKNALHAASSMDLKPVEFQALLNQVKAMGGIVSAPKPYGLKGR